MTGSPQPHPPRQTPRRRALTLVELLVVLAIISVVMSIVVSVFISTQKIFQRAETALDVSANLRVALDAISRDIKQVYTVPGRTVFRGINIPLLFGDGLNNDAATSDTLVDEEQPDGLDNDGDSFLDSHAWVGLFPERADYVGRPDYGDPGVDEDTVFHLDRLQFRIIQAPPVDFLFNVITYEVASFDGMDRVLVRTEERTSVTLVAEPPIRAPLAYNVLSFNCLYWNPNEPPVDQYWLEEWDSSAPASAPGPTTTFEAPASVAVELTIYAGSRPPEDYTDGERVQTTTMRTIVNVESVIMSAGFPRN